MDELLKAVDTSSGEINYTGIFVPAPYCQLLFFEHLSHLSLATAISSLTIFVFGVK